MSALDALRRWRRARRPLWGVYPTKRAAAAILATAPLWLISGSAGRVSVLAAVVAIVALFVLDCVRLPRRNDVTVTRTTAESIGLGDPLTLRYVIRSNWQWPVRAKLYQRLPPAITAAHASEDADVQFDGVAEVALDIVVIARARGQYPLGDVGLRITTPLGLVARLVRLPMTDAVVVVPSLTQVRRFRLLSMQHRLTEAGIRALKQRGEGRSFAGLREYVPGDDPRLVDWKATARHGHLITREHTIERSQTVVTLLDCGRAMTQMAGAHSRLEHVLSAALVLTDVAASSGDRVGLLAFDDAIRAFIAPRRGRAALKEVRQALSALDATLTEPDYAAAFRLLALRQRRRALVVFFTDVIDARVARVLVAHVSRSAQRHVVVVVAIQNDALIAAARPAAQGAGGALAVFRNAAAEELVRERDEALVRMRRAGVAVLDVMPAQMTAAVVNRYLDIKARGAL